MLFDYAILVLCWDSQVPVLNYDIRVDSSWKNYSVLFRYYSLV